MAKVDAEAVASTSNNHLDDTAPSTSATPAKPAPRSVKAKGKKRQIDSENASKLPSSIIAYVPSLDHTLASFSKGFWKHQFDVAENAQEDFKTPELPLARVKRVMKTDPDVVMIASEVPVILEKACQIFISELTSRAYLDSSRRRTLTKGDVIHATTKSDMFDFLIDVAPRDYLTGGTQANNGNNNNNSGQNGSSYNGGSGYQDGSATTAASKSSKSGARNGDVHTGKKGSASGKKAGAGKRKLDDFEDEDEEDDGEEDDEEDDDFRF